MSDLTNWGQHGKLTDKSPYGEHISLTCKHHPHLRWSTKNIAPIGARNIFFKGEAKDTRIMAMMYASECSCPSSDLLLVEEMSSVPGFTEKELEDATNSGSSWHCEYDHTNPHVDMEHAEKSAREWLTSQGYIIGETTTEENYRDKSRDPLLLPTQDICMGNSSFTVYDTVAQVGLNMGLNAESFHYFKIDKS